MPAKAEGNADAVTAVATPEQLQQAVMHGARHIEVTDHMDLTLLDPVRHSDGSFMSGVMFGVLSDTTTSIRVCFHIPQPLQLLSHIPNACQNRVPEAPLFLSLRSGTAWCQCCVEPA